MKFDVQKACKQAWELQWARVQEWKKRGEYYRDTHVTASDLENQVRRFAQEQHDGKPWGSSGAQWGKPATLVRISVGSRMTLLDVCRRWLQDEVRRGRLETFNFGRGHISGARFRPRGTGMTEAEQKTVAEKQRRRDAPRPVHYSAMGYGRSPACVKPRPGSFSRPSRTTRTTSVRADVTCKRCAELLKGVSLPTEKEVRAAMANDDSVAVSRMKSILSGAFPDDQRPDLVAEMETYLDAIWQRPARAPAESAETEPRA